MIAKKAEENSRKRGAPSLKFSDLVPKSQPKAKAVECFMSLLTFQRCGILHLKTHAPTDNFSEKFSQIHIYK
jgi:hypothetical protein